jgi:hypothetical protein
VPKPSGAWLPHFDRLLRSQHAPLGFSARRNRPETADEVAAAEDKHADDLLILYEQEQSERRDTAGDSPD